MVRFRDDQWLARLRGLGMTNDDERKLANLRPHIWKVSQLIAKYILIPRMVLIFSARTKEDKPTSIIHGNAIDLSTLEIKPTNIFFFPPEVDAEKPT